MEIKEVVEKTNVKIEEIMDVKELIEWGRKKNLKKIEPLLEKIHNYFKDGLMES